MNLDHMPELHRAVACPFGLILMVGCALVLCLVFTRRRRP